MQHDEDFDVEAVIAEFMADGSKTTLELPASLSAAQRNVAKGVVGATQGLKSKSFGIGAERQLHLFKAGAGGEDAVRVKNGFIDDWVTDDTSTEPPQFRSMPIGLSRPFETGEVDAISEQLQKFKMRGPGAPPPGAPPGAPPQRSAAPGAELSASRKPPPELLKWTPPENLQGDCFKVSVRDTFIHLEDSQAQDPRAIQSMPDGMFQQSLTAELSARQEFLGLTPGYSYPASAQPPAEPPALAAGAEVVVEGLVKAPAFNGRSGIVQSLDQETGRYNILLDEIPGVDTSRQAKVKFENLRLMAPPPPAFAPGAGPAAARGPYG